VGGIVRAMNRFLQRRFEVCCVTRRRKSWS
jgi:hypothetical protein